MFGQFIKILIGLILCLNTTVAQNEEKDLNSSVGKSFLRANFEWFHGLHASINYRDRVQANVNLGIGIENTYRQNNLNPLLSLALGYDFFKNDLTLALQWKSSLSTYEITPSNRLNYWTNGLGYYFSTGNKWSVFQASYFGRGIEYLQDGKFAFWSYQIEFGVRYAF